MTRVFVTHTDRTAADVSDRRVRRVLGRGAVGAAAVGLALAGTAGIASAQPGQTDDGTTVASVAVGSSIVLSGLPAGFTLSGLPGATVQTGAPVTFNIETNNAGGYIVTVDSQTPTMVGATPGNTDSVPIGALSVFNSDGVYEPLSSTDTATIATKASRSAQGGDALGNNFQVVVPFVNGDTYSATLDYLATTL